ncbi:zinc finger protein RFP-like [Elgaria multicarinata webbii]|uniref:zinc finger protein RFP-like n=1 Tax=Elgaria multicarinata webbii TaxID=159646 RepID=UPI002FCD59D1
MDAKSVRKKTQQEMTCPVCLRYFNLPMTLECGHTFCETCIRRSWAEKEVCPCCRTVIKNTFHPCYSLSNLIEIFNDWEVSAGRETLAWAAECERHKQPLDLFCRDDHAPLCVECHGSQEHGGHSVVRVEEAAQEYKDQITSYLEILQKEKAKNTAYKVDTENKKQVALKKMKCQRKAVKDGFDKLCEYLHHENEPLVEMDLLEEELLGNGELHQAKLSEDYNSLGRMIREMEEKREQPARELLQDVSSTLQRYEERKSLETPGPCPVALSWKLIEYFDRSLFLQSAIEQFKAKVTLDPDTAHPILILSEDYRSVRLGDKCQDVPDNPERFKERAVVLGHKGFTSGRHSWEVIVGDAERWAVGVARKSLQRKAYFNISLEEGVWAMERKREDHGGVTHPSPPMSGELKRVRVVLNYQAQKIIIYDADRATQLYAVSDASFSGEPLVPFFFLGGTGHLTLSS